MKVDRRGELNRPSGKIGIGRLRKRKFKVDEDGGRLLDTSLPQNEGYGEEQRVDPPLAQPGAPGGIRQVM